MLKSTNLITIINVYIVDRIYFKDNIFCHQAAVHQYEMLSRQQGSTTQVIEFNFNAFFICKIVFKANLPFPWLPFENNEFSLCTTHTRVLEAALSMAIRVDRSDFYLTFILNCVLMETRPNFLSVFKTFALFSRRCPDLRHLLVMPALLTRWSLIR